MSVYHPPVEEHENVVKAALRVIGSTHYQRADDPHADAEQEYAEEQLALAARALTQALLLRSLAQEFRVPLSNAVGGYGEVVVRRWTLAQDRWQVTDGSVTDPKVWIDGQWLSIASVGLEKAHPYTLDEALKTAHQVAEYEGAAFEAWVKGTTSVVRGGGE
jgi:hypothetical protein